MSHGNGGIIYNIPISASALSTSNTWDLFTVTADSSSRVELVEIDLVLLSSAYTAFPALGVKLLRGSTTVASTTLAVTPVNVRGAWTGSLAASLTATSVSSTPLSTTSSALVWANGFDQNGRFVYKPEREARPILGLGQRFNLLTSTPQIASTMWGTVTVREIGKGLPS